MKQGKVARWAIAVVLGFCVAAGYDYFRSGNCPLTPLLFIRWAIATILLWSVLKPFSTLLSLPVLRDGLAAASPIGRLADIVLGSGASRTRQILLPTLVIFLLWLPYLVCLWPGNVYLDSFWQIETFTNALANGDFSIVEAKHPLFTTVIYYDVVVGLGSLLGVSFRSGVSLLVGMQLVASALAFGYAFYVLRTWWNCPKKVVFWCLVFVGIVPIVPLAAMSVCKDSFFSWIYVLWLIEFFGIVSRKRPSIPASEVALFIVLTVFACLTKKVGAFVVVISALLAWVVSSSKRRDLCLLAGGLVGFFTYFLLLPFIVSSFGFIEDGPQEKLSIPFQQTALSYLRHGDTFSDEEVATMEEVFTVGADELPEAYSPRNVDPIKGYSAKAGDEAYDAYMQMWLNQALRYPDTYIDAFGSMVSPLFTNDTFQPMFMSDQRFGYGDEVIVDHVSKPAFQTEASAAVEDLYWWLAGLPVVSVLFISFTYAVYVPAQLIVSLIARRRDLFVCVVPVAISFAGLLISPIIGDHFESFRYYMPFIYTAPLVVAFCLSIGQSSEADEMCEWACDFPREGTPAAHMTVVASSAVEEASEERAREVSSNARGGSRPREPEDHQETI